MNTHNKCFFLGEIRIFIILWMERRRHIFLVIKYIKTYLAVEQINAEITEKIEQRLKSFMQDSRYLKH